MNRLAIAMVSAFLLYAGPGAYAQDSMSKGATPKDAMSHEAISKGEKAQRAKAAKKAWMAYDAMSKDAKSKYVMANDEKKK